MPVKNHAIHDARLVTRDIRGQRNDLMPIAPSRPVDEKVLHVPQAVLINPRFVLRPTLSFVSESSLTIGPAPGQRIRFPHLAHAGKPGRPTSKPHRGTLHREGRRFSNQPGVRVRRGRAVSAINSGRRPSITRWQYPASGERLSPGRMGVVGLRMRVHTTRH
jgi:hypothetical protein